MAKQEAAASQVSGQESDDLGSAVTQLISTYEEPKAEPAPATPEADESACETVALDTLKSDEAEQPAEPAEQDAEDAPAEPAKPVAAAAAPAAAAAAKPATIEPPEQKPAFCMKCGATVPAGLAFCTKCGTPVGSAGTPEPAAPPVAAAPAGAYGAMGAMGGAPQGYGQGQGYGQPNPYENPFESPYEPKKKSKGPIIAIVTALVIAALAAAAIFFVLPQFGIDLLGQFSGNASSASSSSGDNEGDEKGESGSKGSKSEKAPGGATDKANAYAISFSFTGKAYDPAKSTPVPVHITGKTDAGGDFDDVVYATNDTVYMIEPGTYTATIDASPLTDNGTLFNVSSYKVKFIVDDKGSALTFDIGEYPIEPGDITDNQISAASAAAKAAGVSDSDVSNKVAATQAARDEAVAAKKKAEDERKAAEEKAAHTYYVCANEFVTLRTSPSTSATAITKIYVREEVYLIEDQGTWSYIEYNGNKGYVLSKFISPDPNAPLNYDDV